MIFWLSGVIVITASQPSVICDAWMAAAIENERALDAVLDIISELVNRASNSARTAEDSLLKLTKIQTSLQIHAVMPLTAKHAMILEILGPAMAYVESVAVPHSVFEKLVYGAAFFSTPISMLRDAGLLQERLDRFIGPPSVRDSLDAHIAIFRNPKRVSLVQLDNMCLEFLEAKLHHVEELLNSLDHVYGSFAESAMVKIIVWRSHLLRLAIDRPQLMTKDMAVCWVTLERLHSQHIRWLLVQQRASLNRPFWLTSPGISQDEFFQSELDAKMSRILSQRLGSAPHGTINAKFSVAAGLLFSLEDDLESRAARMSELDNALADACLKWSRCCVKDPEDLLRYPPVKYDYLHQKCLMEITSSQI